MKKQTSSKKNDAPKRTNDDIYQMVTDRILAALDKGCPPWKKMWKGGASLAPRNAITNRAYRGMNQWLLMVEGMFKGYQDTRWLTFKQAQSIGGSVRKGEKSTEVILWKPMIVPMLDANKRPVLDKKGKPKMKTILFLRTFRVFNIEQCDGLKLPTVKEVPQPEPIEEAERVLKGYLEREDIKVAWGSERACYYPIIDRMEMPEAGQFSHIPEFYSTLAHEITHSTLHEKRCNRKAECEVGTHGFGAEKYGEEELCAEMGAAILMATIGIETEDTEQNSVAYLQNWRDAIKADNRLVMVAASRAQKAVEYVLNGHAVEVEGDDDEEQEQATEAAAA